MATQYEIQNQIQLEQSRRLPLDEYSSGLVDLAKFQAQRRFLQDQAQRANQAAIEAARVHLSGQKELQTQAQKQQSDIETARDKAAFERTELSGKNAEERARIEAASREKAAEIAAAAREKSFLAAATDREKKELIHEFQSLDIERDKGETDDDYISRAQKEARKIRAGHLADLHNRSQDYVQEIDDISLKAAKTHPQRLSDYAWQRVIASEEDPKRQAALRGQVTPAQRDAALAKLGSKGKVLSDTYAFELQKAETAVSFLEPTQQIRIKNLTEQRDDSLSSLRVLEQNPKYASAIPEFNKLIGRKPGEIGGGGAGDFSLARPGGPGGGAGAGAAGAPGRAGLPGEIAPIGPELPGTVVPRPVVPGPVVPPGSTAAALTPDEIYGPGEAGYGWGPGQRTPLVGNLSAPVERFGNWISDYRTPLKGAWNAADLLGASANQWLGTDTLPTSQAMQERANIMGTPQTTNPQLVQAQLKTMGLPPNLNPPERGLPPTPAEIAAFRAGVPARRPLGAGAYPVEIAPTTMPAAYLPGGLGAPPVAAPMPPALNRRALAFDPRPTFGPAPAPVSPTSTLAPEIMGERELRTVRLRQALRLKYPKEIGLLNIDVIPLESLQPLYDRLERERNPTGGLGANPFYPTLGGPGVPAEFLR
jgi:hypothetical protein